MRPPLALVIISAKAAAPVPRPGKLVGHEVTIFHCNFSSDLLALFESAFCAAPQAVKPAAAAAIAAVFIMSRRFISTPDLLEVYWLALKIHISKQGGIAT